MTERGGRPGRRLRVGWFSTGRGEGSRNLLRGCAAAIERGDLDAEIAFVFSNGGEGEHEGSDAFFALVRSLGIDLVTLSDREFRKARGARPARKGEPLPAWRTEYDHAVAEALGPREWDIGVLAGYMLIATEPLVRLRPLLNLHPAAPDGPAGTWQDVIWELIATRADHSGVRIHLGTLELDAGPIVSYCTFPIDDEALAPAWKAIDGRGIESVRAEEGEACGLFQAIRRRGAARELPLLVETLRLLAVGKILLTPEGIVDAAGAPLAAPLDLTAAVERAAAAPAA